MLPVVQASESKLYKNSILHHIRNLYGFGKRKDVLGIQKSVKDRTCITLKGHDWLYHKPDRRRSKKMMAS